MSAINVEGHPPCSNKHFAEYRLIRNHHIGK
jgi:hypothetical protein